MEKTDRQLLDVLAVIAARGARLGVVLRDDNLSAWKVNGKRPGWRALVERLKAGASVGVVGWHADRLMRQPRDLEELIAFGDRGLLLGSCHGEYDLANADHRFQLRILVAAACKASDDTSRRQKRKHEAMRAEGKLNGGTRALGYQAAGTCEHAEGKRCQHVTDEHLAMEREAIAWAAQALLTEASLAHGGGAVERTRDAHVRPDRAAPAGHRGHRALSDAASVRPAWSSTTGLWCGPFALPEGGAVIDLATYEQLQSLFAARRRGRPVSPVFMLSGVLRCSQCGRGMGGETRTDRLDPDGNPRRLYRCPRIGGCGQLSTLTPTRPRHGPSRRPLSVLADPAHAAMVAQASTALAKVELALAAAEETARELSRRLGEGMPFDRYDAAMEPLVLRILALAQERDALVSSGAVLSGELVNL